MAPRNKNYNLIVKEKGLGELKKIQQGLAKTNKSLKNVEKTSRSMAKGMSSLRSSMTGFLAVLSVREIARFSDEVQLLEDRLSVFANEGETGAQVLEQLNVTANKTRASVTSLGEAYNRISINTKDLGLSTQDLLKVTQALQQTFRLSGASSAEATSSLIQLTQGMAQGELRGQELRSVLEANSIFGGLLAKEMGVARGALIKLGEDGALKTSVILKVLNDNFDDLNNQAEKLRPTFEQGVIKGMNELQLSINDLNREYNISGGFFSSVEFIIDNVDTLAIAMAGLAAPAVMGGLITGFKSLTTGLLAANIPLALVAAGLVAANVAANSFIKTNKELGTKSGTSKRIKEINADLVALRREMVQAAKGNLTFLDSISKTKYDVIAESGSKIKELQKELSSLTVTMLGYKAEEDEIKNKSNKGGLGGAEEIKGLQLLNQQLRAGLITMQDYKNAQFGLAQTRINDQFKSGKIDVEEYDKQIKKATEDMNSLKSAQFDLTDAMNEGGESYIKSIGTLSEQIAGATKNAFDTMEGQLVDFVKTGKLRFADLTQSILDDLLKIAIRQAIVAPIAGSLFGGGSALAGAQTTSAVLPSYASTAAKGNAYSGGSLIPYANGGVVGSPTTFGMSGGRTGLMGEAGAEAIMPIERVGGKMGVNASGMGSNVTVNVINNTDGGVETQEREGPNGERILEILIDKKVKESFSSGKLDSTMKTNFGIRRTGV